MKGPILFVRSGALGDFVLTLPVLDALIATGERVDVAIPLRYRVLLPPGVQRVLDIEGRETSWIYEEKNPLGYGSAVAWSPLTVESLRRGGITVYSASPHPSGPAGPHFASAIPLPVGPPRLRIPLPSPDPSGPVVIAPGSGGSAKRWSLENWLEVHERIGGALWVAGPLEVEELWPVPALRLDLLETAALAARCRCWLGPDSGPSHLAAAAGARTGVVFCTTDPGIWAPYGAQVFERPMPERVAEWVRGAGPPGK